MAALGSRSSAGVSLCSGVPVQEEARRHFGCPILEGMELENQGGTGTELNHWEKRLLEVSVSVGPAAAPGRVLTLFVSFRTRP